METMEVDRNINSVTKVQQNTHTVELIINGYLRETNVNHFLIPKLIVRLVMLYYENYTVYGSGYNGNGIFGNANIKRLGGFHELHALSDLYSSPNNFYVNNKTFAIVSNTRQVFVLNRNTDLYHNITELIPALMTNKSHSTSNAISMKNHHRAANRIVMNSDLNSCHLLLFDNKSGRAFRINVVDRHNVRVTRIKTGVIRDTLLTHKVFVKKICHTGNFGMFLLQNGSVFKYKAGAIICQIVIKRKKSAEAAANISAAADPPEAKDEEEDVAMIDMACTSKAAYFVDGRHRQLWHASFVTDLVNFWEVKIMESHQSRSVLKIVCGKYHTAVITKSENTNHNQNVGADVNAGDCYLFGRNGDYQLGNGSKSAVEFLFQSATYADFARVKIEACALGCAHTCLLSNENELYVCGSNAYNQFKPFAAKKGSRYRYKRFVHVPYEEIGIRRHREKIIAVHAAEFGTVLVVSNRV